MGEKARVRIYRFDPSSDRGPRYEVYEIPSEGWKGKKVIDTLRYIFENLDPDLSFREPCRQQLCGACAVLVNKKPVLACEVFSEEEMLIEPSPGRDVIKDLVTV